VPKRKAKQPTAEPSADKLEDVLKMFRNSWDYTKTLHPTWLKWHKLYNNERVLKSFEGVTDTFVPMTFSTVETMVAAIATGDLNVDYVPQDIYKYLTQSLTDGREFTSDTERRDFLVAELSEKLQGGVIEDDDLAVLNALFDYWWESGDWDEKLEHLIRSGLKTGNGAWWLSWEDNRPCLYNVPFRDFIFDPTATNDDTCGYMGRRYLSTIDKLKSVQIIDPETQELVPRYKGLDSLHLDNHSGKNEDNTDKEVKEYMLLGSTMPGDVDQVEVIEIVTPERVYTALNRKYLVEDIENPTLTQAKAMGLDMPGILPGITWANYKDESLYIGKSEVETFWKEQERLNDLSNQKGDSITRTLIQNKRIDPKYSALSKMLDIPGAVLPIPQGAVEVLPQAQVPYQVFQEENSIKNNIREVSATDQIVKGVGGGNDVTATEAKLQVAQAGQRIEMKIKSLERGPLKRLARLVFAYARLFVTDPMIVPTRTNKGIAPKLYTPKKYTQDFEPRVQLNIYAKDRKREEQRDAIEMYKILIQDPTNDLQAVKKILLPKIIDVDKAELEDMTKKPEEMQPDDPMSAAPMEEVPPMDALPPMAEPMPPMMEGMPV
jgi:hypothetical protein